MVESILLVDDEEDIREVVGVSLSDLGYRVVTAVDGNQGLDIYREILPSVVLTDIKMPGLDGIELLRAIKADDPETEVIMLTGHGDMDLAIKSLKYEATDFITKPINVDALEIALSRAVDRIRIRQKLKEYTEHLEQLIKEKTELQDHLSSLGLMIGTISHSIKGLLTGLDGGMYMLDAGFKNTDYDRMSDGWEAVRTIAQRIRKLVMDILFYAKERDLNWESVDLAEFAKSIVLAVEPKAREHGIEFSIDCDTSIGEVTIDSSLIHSALINILDNAVDACINDSLKKDHKITFSMKDGQDHIVFNIHDNGIGMDRGAKEKLFTLFYSTKGIGGTGLGLFITSQIIRQHEGSISVNSALGQGSHFSVKLPKQRSTLA